MGTIKMDKPKEKNNGEEKDILEKNKKETSEDIEPEEPEIEERDILTAFPKETIDFVPSEDEEEEVNVEGIKTMSAVYGFLIGFICFMGISLTKNEGVVVTWIIIIICVVLVKILTKAISKL